MSLQGTLDTFALTDVLALLSSTKKVGELKIAGSTVNGSLWLDTGQLVGAEVPRSPTLVDAVFELLRLEEGSFSFEADSPVRTAMEPSNVGDILADAEERLVEWRDIAAVVPSLNVIVALAPEPPTHEITVDAQQWRVLVGVAPGRPLAEVAQHLGLGEFEACRIVKHLVESSLATVHVLPAGMQAPAPTEAPAPAPAQQPAPQAPAPAQQPAAQAPAPAQQPAAAAQAPAPAQQPPAQQPAAAAQQPAAAAQQPAAAAQQPPAQQPPAAEQPQQPAAQGQPGAGQPGDEQVDRGALLKFLSSVRN